MPTPDDMLAQLDALLAAIQAYPDPRRAAAEWKKAYAILKKTPAAGNHLDNVIMLRDVPGLAAMIGAMRAGDAAPKPEPAGPPVDEGAPKAAMKAFKRRLKLAQLDDESRIDSREPTTKGAGGKITGIVPPREWAPEIWAELVRRGVLRRAGSGMCEMVRELPA